MPGRDSGAGQRLVQGGQGLRGPAGRMRRCATVQCRSTRRSGSTVWARASSPPARPRRRRRPGRARPRAVPPGGHAGLSQPGSSRRPGGGVPPPPGVLADQQLCRAGQPAQYPLIQRIGRVTGSANCPQQLAGHPVRGSAGLSKGAGGIAVPGGPHRCWYLVVQRSPDQRMPEREAVARIGQHASRACLGNGRNQVGHAATEDGRQIRHGKVDAEQRRCAQHLAHRADTKPRRSAMAGSGNRPPTVRQLDRSRVGNGQT